MARIKKVRCDQCGCEFETIDTEHPYFCPRCICQHRELSLTAGILTPEQTQKLFNRVTDGMMRKVRGSPTLFYKRRERSFF